MLQDTILREDFDFALSVTGMWQSRWIIIRKRDQTLFIKARVNFPYTFITSALICALQSEFSLQAGIQVWELDALHVKSGQFLYSV